MKNISLIGLLSLFLLLTNQVLATDHLASNQKPFALVSRDNTTEIPELPANTESSFLIAQAETDTQESTQAEFERRQKRIVELEAAIQKRIEEVKLKQAVTEKTAPATLHNNSPKPSTWKTLAILAAVLLGLLTLLRMWWQNRQEKEMETRAIEEAIEAADSDVSSSDLQDSTPSENISTKPDTDSAGITEPESDPISAAAIFLAFEQRERAIQVLKDALLTNSAQGDITNKLLTLYANDGNISAFTSLFESAAESIENEAQWTKIKALAEATIPEHKIHAYDSNASVPILQDAIEKETINSLNPDEFDSRNTGENAESGAVTDESHAISSDQLSASNIQEADTHKQQEDSTLEKTTKVSQKDLKTTLALAKAYLDIQNDDAAVGFLTDVTNNDQGALGQEAQALLDSLDNDLLDRTISKRPGTRDSQMEFSEQRAIIERPVVIEKNVVTVTGAQSEDQADPSESDADAEEFDLILDKELEEVNIHDPETALTLAKAYIDLGEDDLARDFLNDADVTDKDEDKAEIKRLLKILDQKQNDNTQKIVERRFPKEAPLDEISSTEIYKNAHPAHHEAADIPVDTELGERGDGANDKQDLPAKAAPKVEIQHKKQAQRKNPNIGTEATAQNIEDLDTTKQEPGSHLALAKSYIALEEYDLARNFLNRVVQTGNSSDEFEATKILSILDEDGDLNFIFNFETLPDSSAYEKRTDPDDDAHKQMPGTENKSVEDDASGDKDRLERETTSLHTEGNTELKIERLNVDGKANVAQSSSLDSQENVGDQTSKTEKLMTENSVLYDQTSKDIPGYRRIDSDDQESEIVELGPHDPETALELAKAYIELGDEKTARKVLVEVTQSEKKKCVLQAQAILASLDSSVKGAAIADPVQTPALDKDIELTVEKSHTDISASEAATSIGPPEDDGESILIETEQHDPETAIELAYAYIELGESKIAKKVLRDIIAMAASSERIKAKAKAALSSLA